MMMEPSTTSGFQGKSQGVDFDKGGKPENQEKHPPVWLRSTDIKNAEVDSARDPVDHIEPA